MRDSVLISCLPVYVCVYRVLEKYYVGELLNNELPVFPKPG